MELAINDIGAKLVVAEQHARNAVTHIEGALAARQEAVDCYSLTKAPRGRVAVQTDPAQRQHLDLMDALAEAADDDLAAASDAITGIENLPTATAAIGKARSLTSSLRYQAKYMGITLDEERAFEAPRELRLDSGWVHVYDKYDRGRSTVSVRVVRDGWRALRNDGLGDSHSIARNFRRDDLLNLSTVDGTFRDHADVGSELATHTLEDAARARAALNAFLEQAQAIEAPRG